MASRDNDDTNPPNGNSRGGDVRKTLIGKAVRYARVTRKDRGLMHELLAELEHPGLGEQEELSTPPRAFVQALRRPKNARRKTIAVVIDGVTVPLLLNPQGKTDREREQWLWNFCRTLVREVRSER